MTDKSDHRPSEQRLRLTLRQLEVFVATARTGSTRAAADRVSRSQSAASSALADLEATLERPLFDRVGRRLLLNEDGRELLPASVALLDHARELEGRYAVAHASQLRMASSFTIGEYVLPERVASWKRTHPDGSARLVIGNTSEVIDAVANFEVDLGFIEGRQRHPDVVVRPWFTDELVAFAASGHPLCAPRVSGTELAKAGWVLREPGSGTREAADRWLAERLGAVRVEFELGSSEAVKRVVAAGVGVGCLSRRAVAEAIAQGWLCEVKPRWPRARRMLSIVVHRQRPLGRAAAAFLNDCLENGESRSHALPNPPPRRRRLREPG